jgi:hypothetical protein
MARGSFERYQRMLGSPGTPVEWRKGYFLSETPIDRIPPYIEPDEPAYPSLKAQYLAGLVPPSYVIPREQLPFPQLYAMGYTQLVFNVGILSQLLVDNFLRAGGKIEVREFRNTRELMTIDEEIIVNATGYGARQLFGDASIVPVRGQTVLLLPQPEVDYGLTWRSQNLSVVSRRDGILLQERGPREFDNADNAIDMGAAEAAVRRLAKLYDSSRLSPWV